jgi:ADP-ribosyl-[dinitrogen reductase] hydrolase
VTTSTLRDRMRGCLFGLAVGDALGAQVEFKPRSHCRAHPVTDMEGGGPWRAFPGMWTDDTAMAFAMGDAIAAYGRFDAGAVMRNFIDWRQGIAFGPSDGRGCFDIGGTTSAALARFARTGEPLAGATDAHTAANGCIMRLAPVPIFTLNLPAVERLRIAADSSRLTHAEPRCVDCTCLLAEILRDWMLSDGTAAPMHVVESFDAATPELRALIGREAWSDRTDADIKSSGYVIDTLEAALWAVYGADDFASAVLRAVNLGGDADTVGAVAGQLAGAWYGYGDIPLAWRGRLDRGAELLGLADRLCDLAHAAKAA